MADDPSHRGPRDRARISLSEEHDVRYWTQALGVGKERLAVAVKAVGHSVDRVREHLKRR